MLEHLGEKVPEEADVRRQVPRPQAAERGAGTRASVSQRSATTTPISITDAYEYTVESQNANGALETSHDMLVHALTMTKNYNALTIKENVILGPK